MRRASLIASLLLVAATTVAATTVSAAPIYFESAALGTTGIHGGTSLSAGQYLAVRFEVTQAIQTESIGGHLGVGNSPGSLWGAIIALTGPADFPDSTNLTTPDVVGSTTFGAPQASTEVEVPLARSLSPGWYALMFGGGLFATVGAGYMPGTDSNIGAPSYFFSDAASYFNGGITNTRFFVRADEAAVPEPAMLALIGSGLAGILARRQQRRHR